MDAITIAIIASTISAAASIVALIVALTRKQSDNRDALATLNTNVERVEKSLRDEFSNSRNETSAALQSNRTELAASLELNRTELNAALEKSRLETTAAHEKNRTELTTALETYRVENTAALQANRTELTTALETYRVENTAALQANRTEITASQAKSREELAATLETLRATIETRLQRIQADNAEQLERMRKTVDEKLQESVEKRFNESFKLISERLEEVHKGLGEMQSLAVGVGDLKKVLSNVKTRGNLGEYQLGAILEQILAPEQFERNAHVRADSADVVEFAVRIPSKAEDSSHVLIPIDSKFPVEDYLRLVEAQDNLDGTDAAVQRVDAAGKAFEASVKRCARDIFDKYVNPPVTTDFAMMFVPTEGLYAEVLRRTGLFEELQTRYKVLVVGPTNTAAFLSSLQMGFRTLAIEKRSGEVWNLLGAVKTEFGKFGEVVDSAQKSLAAATNHLDKLNVRSRAIGRHLRSVAENSDSAQSALPEFDDEII